MLDDIENIETNYEVVPASFGACILNKVIESLDGIFQIRSQSDLIKQEIRYVKNGPYMKLMQSETYTRAHEDLRRAFSRALQELRKHQEWKLRNKSIEMAVSKIYKTD